jgi:(p)ppGpp synthase/HD superfamily hydrolase
MKECVVLSERFEAALSFATQLHRHQARKGTAIPYLSHLLSVTALVLEAGGGEDEAIAALLHDAIEDQGGDNTRQVIGQRFGSTVGDLVEACTDSDECPKPPWQERKLRHLQRLREAQPPLQPQVRRIVLADKLHNARSTLAELRSQGPQVWSKFKAGRTGTLWFYGAVLEQLGSPEDWLTQELKQTLKALQTEG